MSPDLSVLTISTTKPAGRVARALAGKGIRILPVPEDEGNVDRYILSKRLVLERRTGGGFLKGIMEKTLFTSAIYLREHFQIPVLVVEGKVNYQHTMFDPQAVRGALSSMLIQYGLNVLSTQDQEETVELITMMARQEQIGIPEISLIPKRKAADLPDLQRRMIEMLPGCGRVMARELLQRFGSVNRVVGARKEELRQVRGVGAKTANGMFAVLNSEYGSVDTERNLEDAIEAQTDLLFGRRKRLLARQLYIFSDGKDRNFIDLAFVDEKAAELILVELKRGVLTAEARAQLRRYLDRAGESALLRELLDRGFALRGVLASVEPSDYCPPDDDIDVKIVNEAKAIRVLKRLRRERQGEQ